MHTDTLRFIIATLAILNPVGNAMLFLGMTTGRPLAEIRKEAIKCTIAVGIILVITVWLGAHLLQIFGVSLSAFSVAGGIIVFLIGLSLLQTESKTHHYHKKDQLEKAQSKPSIAVVPMAIPIIAGPGAIATLMTHTALFNTPMKKITESLFCVGLALITGCVLYLAPLIAKALGEEGVKIVTRIMGLIICAIAIQMIINGIHLMTICAAIMAFIKDFTLLIKHKGFYIAP